MLPEGIYLRVKKSTRGVGHTAVEQTFKFYYALRHAGEKQVELILLDETQKLKPTPLKEMATLSQASDLVHVAKLQPFFEKLKPLLGAPPAAPAPKKPAPQPAAQAAAKPAKPQDEKKEGGWWDMTSPGSGLAGKKF